MTEPLHPYPFREDNNDSIDQGLSLISQDVHAILSPMLSKRQTIYSNTKAMDHSISFVCYSSGTLPGEI